LCYMRGLAGKYETEIRLGLVFIVALLLLLNISTAYILNHVKKQLSEDAVSRLASGLENARQYLEKNRLAEIDIEHTASIVQKNGIEDIATIRLSRDADSFGIELNRAMEADPGLPDFDDKDVESLIDGDLFFCASREEGRRYGMVVTEIDPDSYLLIYAQYESAALQTIGHASRLTLYLALAVILLIIPLALGLPRQILKPFKKMKETAISAGKLKVSDDTDEVSELINSYQNIIEELKRSEAELERLYRESSSRAKRLERINRYILKSIGSGVINIDLTGRIISCNQAAQDLLGYEEEMMLGQHYLAALPHEMELNLLIQAGLERGEVFRRREIDLKRQTGPDLWVGVESSIILDDQEKVIGVTVLITDLTEVKKLQNELETNRRLAALGEMTGGLAHQLRNSLAAISGFSQLLQKKTAGEADLGEIADSIRDETTHAERMVSRFLNFSRPLALSSEIFDLVSLIEECLNKLVVESDSHEVSVNFDKPDSVLNICGDHLFLKEAVGNIIDNAVEAAGRKGQVDIILRNIDDEAFIEVADNGPGIEHGIRDKIFTPFVSSKPSGTGLGLALARKIIDLHRGKIIIEDGHPCGTVCSIMLPCVSVVESVPSAETASKKE